jgi:hypothetical protein
MYTILHNYTKRYLLLPFESGGNNKKLLLFKYPSQARNYIQRHLGDSSTFSIIDLKKKGVKCQKKMTK